MDNNREVYKFKVGDVYIKERVCLRVCEMGEYLLLTERYYRGKRPFLWPHGSAGIIGQFSDSWYTFLSNKMRPPARR